MPDISTEILPEVFADLFHRAQAAAEHAYAPYSQFKVGAALLFDDGTRVTGCNVENASYGLTSFAPSVSMDRADASSPSPWLT
jgi:cytidine deaminase